MEEQNNITEPKKEKGKTGLIVGLIIVILILAGIIAILLLKPTLFNFNNTSNGNNNGNPDSGEKEDKKEETPKTFDLANFDSTKSLNKKSNIKYGETATEANTVMSKPNTSPVVNYISVELQDSKKEAVISANWDEMLYNGKSKEYTYTISNFDKKISKVYVTGWGQAIGSETVFYIMEDGTLEYTPVPYNVVKEAANNNGSITLKSNGKVPNVEDVVMIATVSAAPTDSPVGGYVAAIAIKSDGSFYDLTNILNGESIYQANY